MRGKSTEPSFANRYLLPQDSIFLVYRVTNHLGNLISRHTTTYTLWHYWDQGINNQLNFYNLVSAEISPLDKQKEDYSHGKKDTDPYNISPIEMRSL